MRRLRQESIKLDQALKFILVAPLAVTLGFLVGYVVKKLPLTWEIVCLSGTEIVAFG